MKADEKTLKAAIVDYEICNLFSVKRALEFSGFQAAITQDPKEIMEADVVILPGVGAFPDAMASLKRLDLISPLTSAASSGKPIVGICLGFQMLFSVSYEFGETPGLNFIPGLVKKFENAGNDCTFKIPHIGWDPILTPGSQETFPTDTYLAGIKRGEHFYFVHSYCAIPEDSRVILSKTPYGTSQFCSSVQQKNISGFQFHPERSGPAGIAIYQNIKMGVQSRKLLSHV